MARSTVTFDVESEYLQGLVDLLSKSKVMDLRVHVHQEYWTVKSEDRIAEKLSPSEAIVAKVKERAAEGYSTKSKEMVEAVRVHAPDVTTQSVGQVIKQLVEKRVLRREKQSLYVPGTKFPKEG